MSTLTPIMSFFAKFPSTIFQEDQTKRMLKQDWIYFISSYSFHKFIQRHR